MLKKINQAIEEAQTQLKKHSAVVQSHKAELSTATPAPAAQSNAISVATFPMPSIAPDASPILPAPALAQTPQTPDLNTASAVDLRNRASVLYRDRTNYLSSYEVAEEALKLNPNDRGAQRLQENIRRDLKDRVVDLVPYDEPYRVPEGLVVYKVAVSDNLFTEDEAVDVAVQNSVMLQSLARRIEGAKRKLSEAKRALFPTVGGEVSVNGGVLAGEAYSGESFKVNLSQPVFYGGELLFTIKQAESNLESDRFKFQKERMEIAHQTVQAYRQVVNADYNLRYQNELFEEVSKYYGIATKAFEEKLLPPIDQLETESVYNQVYFQRESAVSALQSAHLGLFQAMGVELHHSVPVDVGLDFEPLDVELGPFLRMVRNNNLDVKIKDMATKSAYYAVKVFDAQRLPRVDIRGSVGMAGEVKTGGDADPSRGINVNGPFASGPDLEDEHFIGVNVEVPWGPHTGRYNYQRRFFAPSISSFLGSEDYRHTWNVGLFDRMAALTDEEIAKAEYLKAKAELQQEEMAQEIAARQAYFDYQGSLIQIRTADSKVRFREKQVAILKHTTSMDESRLSELLEELVSLAEDRYAEVTSISSAKVSLSNMTRLTGIEGYYYGKD